MWTSVDLVAEGRLIAIQCKIYAPRANLTKEEIDSFVALSGQKQWTRCIIVATTDLWSTNAEKPLQGHAVPVERIGRSTPLYRLRQASLVWPISGAERLAMACAKALAPEPSCKTVNSILAAGTEHDQGDQPQCAPAPRRTCTTPKGSSAR